MCLASSCSMPWIRGSLRYDLSEARKYFVTCRRPKHLNRFVIICLNGLFWGTKKFQQAVDPRYSVETVVNRHNRFADVNIISWIRSMLSPDRYWILFVGL